jgi:hypothetical protein
MFGAEDPGTPDDTEGHQKPMFSATEDDDTAGHVHMKAVDDDDTAGHVHMK